MFAILGSIVFEQLFLPESFDSSYGLEYAKHSLIAGKPRLQKIGEKLDEHSISIRLHDIFCDPDTEIEKLKAACRAGEILPFITGAGVVMGDFVIENISLSRKEADPEGRLKEAVISLSLTEHVAPDPLGAKKEKAKQEAFASSEKQPQLIEPAAMRPARMEPAAFMAEANVAKVEAGKVDRELKTAQSNPVKRAAAMAVAERSLAKMDQAFSSMNKQLESASNAQLQAQQLKDQLATLQQSGALVKSLVQAGSLSDAIHANTALQANTKIFSSACAPIAALTAQRSA